MDNKVKLLNLQRELSIQMGERDFYQNEANAQQARANVRQERVKNIYAEIAALEEEIEFSGTIPLNDMLDGQIAIITHWPARDYIGRVVQRYDLHLISVGKPSGESWGVYFDKIRDKNTFRVRLIDNLILEKQ